MSSPTQSPTPSREPLPPWLDAALAEAQAREVRASGPGGQHVNKTSSAIELRFDAAGSPSVPEAIRARLLRLAGRRLNQAGELVIVAQEHRSAELNRRSARSRLAALLLAASRPPRPRVATRPSAAARRRRLEAKARRGRLKQSRGEPPPCD